MKPAVHHVLLFLMALSLMLYARVALADPAALVVPTAVAGILPTLVMLALVLISYAARRFAPQGQFFHTAAGAFVLSLVTTSASVAASVIQTNGLNAQAIVNAIVGGVLSLLATANPSVPIGQTAPLAMKKRPESGRASMETVLLLSCLALAGCAGLQAWKVCELGKLPQAVQSVIPTIVTDLGGVDSATAITQVENIGAGLLPDQISCIVQAIAADMATPAVKGEPSPLVATVQKNAGAFLRKHPATACGDNPDLRRQVALVVRAAS